MHNKYIDWDNQPLGRTPDRVLARSLGVNRTTVLRARRRRGIAPFEPAPKDKIPQTLPSRPDFASTEVVSASEVLTYLESSRSLSDNPADREPDRGIAIVDESDAVDEVPIDELIAARVKAGRRKVASAAMHRRTLRVPCEPFALAILGDPHVDNRGCDWHALVRHVELFQQTPGVLTACVGDMQDHWIGRLGKLYAESDCTASDGWRLSEWLLRELQWVALVGGNHDAWAQSPGLDPYKWLADRCQVTCYAPDELRITFTFEERPELEPIVWILRHDFGGRSWYHPTHGPHKEAMLDGRCHLLTAGHIHQWGHLTTEQRHGRVTHAIRVRGYKRNDSYARQKGFTEQMHGEACLVVIDPVSTGPGRLTVFWDLKTGCEHLTWLRERRAGE
ncbi:MAG: hypothetical protein CL484_00330 [Acidobacteria bacterium]|nr:hypothetical protein [Acidobacteriota bacterium]|tara:strand:- start:1830 stop:3002 length:1173 start_codon:yes stop_codon:yes gene_type:complete